MSSLVALRATLRFDCLPLQKCQLPVVSGDFLRFVPASIARELPLWRRARQLSYEDPYVVLKFIAEWLGGARTPNASHLSLHSLYCVVIRLADLLGVGCRSRELPSWCLNFLILGLFPRLPRKIEDQQLF